MSSSAVQVDDSGFSDRHFQAFQKLTLESTGIHLGENKRAMLVTRLSRRLRALKLTSYDAYLQILSDRNHSEHLEFIDTVTTNLTYFFREPHHFEILRERALPELLDQRTVQNPVRIWSAGCSAGQEPYSLAITLSELERPTPPPARILCTDIHTKLVAQTQAGIYKDNELRGLDPQHIERFFTHTRDGHWQASRELREHLLCKRLNLFEHWPLRSKVDVIMCRNVLIYFEDPLQQKIIEGFASVQKPGAWLFLGHSETMRHCTHLYQRVENTVFRRL